MTWQRLQELKVQVLEHASRHGHITPEGEYWWRHYRKLHSLQIRLVEEDEEPDREFDGRQWRYM